LIDAPEKIAELNMIWITSRKTEPNEETGRNAAGKVNAGTAASRLATGRAFARMTAGKTVRMTIPDYGRF
jgi:hypothetical protein